MSLNTDNDASSFDDNDDDSDNSNDDDDDDASSSASSARRTLRTIAMIRARAPAVLDGSARVFEAEETANDEANDDATPLDETDAFLQRYLRTRAWADDNDAAVNDVNADEVSASASERQQAAQDAYEDAYRRRHLLRYTRDAFETLRERPSKRAEAQRRRKERARQARAERLARLDEQKDALRGDIARRLREILNGDAGTETGTEKVDALRALRKHPLLAELAEKDFDAADWDDTLAKLFEADEPGRKKGEKTEKPPSASASQSEDPLDPALRAELDGHYDDLMRLDEVDYVPGLGPVRFRYATVEPDNLGMTPAEILLASDEELERRARRKKVGRNGRNERDGRRRTSRDDAYRRK